MPDSYIKLLFLLACGKLAAGHVENQRDASYVKKEKLASSALGVKKVVCPKIKRVGLSYKIIKLGRWKNYVNDLIVRGANNSFKN
jgi:hypothetical protein